MQTVVEYEQWQAMKTLQARLLDLLKVLDIYTASELLAKVAAENEYSIIAAIVADAETQAAQNV